MAESAINSIAGTFGRSAKLFTTALFNRAVKKLHVSQKAGLDCAIEQIAQNVECGQEKAGDLSGARVYKFKLTNQLCLLVYCIIDNHRVKLLAFGPHENFYRDLSWGESQ